MATVNGTSGNDFIHVSGDGQEVANNHLENANATDNDDTINSGVGGSDIIHAGAGNDIINFANDLDSTDQIDGGIDYDRLVINDQTSITFGAHSLTSIEEIDLPDVPLPIGFAGFQSITMNNANLLSGNTMVIDGRALGVNMFMTFDGSAERDGHFTVYGGHGSDNLTGGRQQDVFHLEYGGDDTAISGGGDDVFYFGDAFTGSDRVVGDSKAGGTIQLFGTSYAAGLTLSATTMTNVTLLYFDDGGSYNLTMDDGNVANGKVLTVNGAALSDSQHLTFNGAAETNGEFYIYGGSGNDTLTGGAKADTFDLFSEGNIIFGGGYGGGADTASGGGGNDQFLGVLDGDVIDGGAGVDTVEAVTPLSDFEFDFAANTLTNVERLKVSGLFYIWNDGCLAAGKTLTVTGNPSSFDGTAETDGHFKFVQGAGDASFKGGSLKDTFDVTGGGGSHISGNGSDDVFLVGAAFDDHDEFDGGTGTDVLRLAGDYSAGMTFSDTSITNIEKLLLGAHFSYNFTSADANVAAGAKLNIDGSALGTANAVSFNGSAETDGSFEFIGGAGADSFIGGAKVDTFTGGDGKDTLSGRGGADLLFGGKGADTLTGGGGGDKFIFTNVADSKGTGIDRINDFSHAQKDRIDLSGIDANTGMANDQAFHLTGSGGTDPFSHTAGELRYHVSGADTLVTGDVNGDGVADFQITLTGNLTLTAGDFVL